MEELTEYDISQFKGIRELLVPRVIREIMGGLAITNDIKSLIAGADEKSGSVTVPCIRRMWYENTEFIVDEYYREKSCPERQALV
jgi:hypothetical protein